MQFYFTLKQNSPSFLNHTASIQLRGEIWRFRILCRWKDQFVHFKVLPDTALHKTITWGIIIHTLPPFKWERGWPKVEKQLLVGGIVGVKRGRGQRKREEVWFSKVNKGEVETFVGKKIHVHNLIDLFLHVCISPGSL